MKFVIKIPQDEMTQILTEHLSSRFSGDVTIKACSAHAAEVTCHGPSLEQCIEETGHADEINRMAKGRLMELMYDHKRASQRPSHDH